LSGAAWARGAAVVARATIVAAASFHERILGSPSWVDPPMLKQERYDDVAHA